VQGSSGVVYLYTRWGNPRIGQSFRSQSLYEAFDAGFREECLNQRWFAALEEARTTVEVWRMDYNAERPHTAQSFLDSPSRSH
jgi:Integrase core domain